MLDVFRSGTMQVEKKKLCTPYVQIKYLEASWPGALVAHRIQPLHGSMNAHTEKQASRWWSGRPRSKLCIYVAQSHGFDSGVSLAQRRRQTARSIDIFEAREQHWSEPWRQQDLHLAWGRKWSCCGMNSRGAKIIIIITPHKFMEFFIHLWDFP